MRFTIKCSTFLRLSSICNFFEPETPQELRSKINTLRLEASDGKIIAVCTNQRIMAAELIGFFPPGQNEVAHIVLDPILINQCKKEALHDGFLTIDTIPSAAMAMITSSSGWIFEGKPCHWFDDTPLDDWRKCFMAKPLSKSEGIMQWNLLQVQSLFESSPTGKIIFPRFINANDKVILQDLYDPNWTGVFIPAAWGNPIQKQEATLPEWIKL